MNRRQILAVGAAGISAAAIKAQAADAASNPELENVKALLKKHDDAMTSHDVDGVLSTLSDDAILMGTGPGEFWKGKEELKDAYEHFFQVFDKGDHASSYNQREGGLTDTAGWLLASGEVKGKKDGKDISFPINVSLTVSKSGDDWKIVGMHFSVYTGKAAE